MAFAEVFTVIEFMHDRRIAESSGFAITNKLLETLRTGASMDESLKQAVGSISGSMQKEWRRFLKEATVQTHSWRQAKTVGFLSKGDTQNARVEEEEDERAVADADSVQNRKWVRLGNLLRRRE